MLVPTGSSLLEHNFKLKGRISDTDPHSIRIFRDPGPDPDLRPIIQLDIQYRYSKYKMKLYKTFFSRKNTPF
jgi:hypothetical protein